MDKIKTLDAVYWVGTSIMLFFGFGLIYLALFYTNYVTKMKRKEAELLLKASLESEKKERVRIAADLHDSVSSDLSAIRNYLSIILKGETDSKRIVLFEELKEGVETAIENTRLVSYKLMPPLLDKLGFISAVSDYFKRLNKQTSINFVFKYDDLLLEMEENTAYELYRIIQEFVTNMMKYGNVKECVIIPYVKESLFYIELIDDGLPFDFKTSLTQSKGTGLKNISSRVKVIGGTLEQRQVLVGNHFVLSVNLKS